MANWASVIYKAVGEKDDLQRIYEILTDLQTTKEQLCDNDFGNMWLGNLLVKLGFDWQNKKCRGYVSSFSLDDFSLDIFMETAWGEQCDVRYAIMEAFPGTHVYFMEEELGCGVCYTNDKNHEYFEDRYIVTGEEIDTEYFSDIELAAQYISSVTGISPIEPTLEAVQEAINEYTDRTDECLNIYEFEYTED